MLDTILGNPLWLYLPAIILLGIKTIIDDIREKKVKNRVVYGAMLYGLFAIALYLSLLKISGNDIIWFVVGEHAFNIILSIAIGFAIWYAGLWGAGDGKLFIAYAMLLPLTVYEFGRVRLFPAITVLINTFVPLFAYCLFVILKDIRKMRLTVRITDFLGPRNLLAQAAMIFAFQWVAKFVSWLFMYQLDMLITLFIIYFVYIIAYGALGKNLNKTVIAMAVARAVIDIKSLLSIKFYLDFAAIYLLFLLLRYLLQIISHEIFARRIFIEDLAPGMIPAENLFKTKSGYKAEPIIHISVFQDIESRMQHGKPLFMSPADGMTETEVKEIRRLHSGGKYKPHELKIYQTMSFAPYIFAGALLTVLIKGNILFYIRYLIEKMIGG